MNYCDGVGQKGLVDCDPENGQCEICYMADLDEENKKLKADNESLRKDAERYRHLKLDATDDGSLIERLDCNISVMNWDSAIDAAMSQGEKS